MLAHRNRQGRVGKQQQDLSRLYVRLSLALLVLIIAAGLAACGPSSGGTANPANPTSTASTRVQKCGSVQTQPRGEPADPASARRAADCFWQAFRQCHSASLTYTASGIDTIATHTFTIQHTGSQCSVVDVMKHQIVPQPPTPAKTYTCSGVTQQANGLHFASCGAEGDIVVPTTAPAR